jgi:hypothetical protein
MFRRNISLPSSGLKSKLSKKPAAAGRKLTFLRGQKMNYVLTDYDVSYTDTVQASARAILFFIRLIPG